MQQVENKNFSLVTDREVAKNQSTIYTSSWAN